MTEARAAFIWRHASDVISRAKASIAANPVSGGAEALEDGASLSCGRNLFPDVMGDGAAYGASLDGLAPTLLGWGDTPELAIDDLMCAARRWDERDPAGDLA